jgi:hypothetical protein
LPSDCSSSASCDADGLHRQSQALGGARDAAFLGHHPEVIQVAEIHVAGFHHFYLSFYEVILHYLLFFKFVFSLHCIPSTFITKREKHEAFQSVIYRHLPLPAARAGGATARRLAGALSAFGIAAILAVMEVSLSFDNAVVNASVLKTWDEFWKKLFLGVGIIIAVFGMRLLFPLVIVAVAADLGIMDVWTLALNDPKEYSMHLTNHHAEVAAFGGMFLLLVFLNFLFDDEKEHHWLGNFEEEARLAGQGVLDLGDDRDRRVLMASLSLVPKRRRWWC